MRLLVASVILVIGTGCTAGTLKIDWVGGTQYLTQDMDGPLSGNALTMPPYIAGFSFTVPRLTPAKFTYQEVFYGYGPMAPANPQTAALTAVPVGHLGPYSEGDWIAKISRRKVSVEGSLCNSDDCLLVTADALIESHNQGLFIYESKGYWTASYMPDHPGDGAPFTIAPVPLTTGGIPLVGALLSLIGLSKRYVRTFCGYRPARIG